jgi:hypothetical protein
MKTRLSGNKIYAGIGARKTPPEILSTIETFSAVMAAAGWRLRSGGAEGADESFLKGADYLPLQRAIYLPGASFNGKTAGSGGCHDATKLPGWSKALETVDRYHPRPSGLSPFARKLMARNAMQILGPSLDSPANLVVAWTLWGQVVGGTGQALRIAIAHGIPILNLGLPKDLERVEAIISAWAKKVASLSDPKQTR